MKIIKPRNSSWTDICSCNICIHHVPVVNVSESAVSTRSDKAQLCTWQHPVRRNNLVRAVENGAIVHVAASPNRWYRFY